MPAERLNTTTDASTTFWMLADEFGQMYGERPSASPQAPDTKNAPPVEDVSTVRGLAEPKTDDQRVQDLYRDLHMQPAYPRTALCLSGGGIRSAAFALGVIQSLAKARLLHRFEYLSTVSGGGYIGSWLSAWCARAADPEGKGAYAKIGPQLAHRAMPEHEPPELDNLRANSNYLTPRLGALSADTWSAVAIWLRNLLINWFLLIPLIAAAAVTPQVVSALTGAAERGDWAPRIQAIGILCYFFSLAVFTGARPRWRAFGLDQPKFLIFSWLPLLVSAAMWAISMAHPASDLTAFWRPLFPKTIGPFANPIPDYGFLAVLLYAIAIIIAAVWNAIGAEPYVRTSKPVRREESFEYSFTRTRATGKPAGVEVYTEDHQAVAGRHYIASSNTIWFAPGESDGAGILKVELTGRKIDDAPIRHGDFLIKFRNPRGVRIGALSLRVGLWDALVFIFSGACFGLFIGAGDLWLRSWFGTDGQMSVGHHLAFSTVAVPWLLLSHGLATVIFTALTSWLPRSDEEREWIGRAVGWVLVVVVLWIAIATLVLLVPYGAAALLAYFNISPATIDPKSVATVVSAVGTASGILTAIVGGGPKTAAIPGQRPPFLRNFALYFGAPLFLASLFVGLALAIDWLALGQTFAGAIGYAGSGTEGGSEIDKQASPDFMTIAIELFKYGAIPALASVLIGWFININRFSLHEMYRNRLVRAFLGASNTSPAQRDLFTFFNFTDNLPVSRLWTRREENDAPNKPGMKPPASETDWRPFQVLNIALNLVDTDKPAWQERKAESFTVSPLWCGSAQLNAFRRASEYGGKRDTLTLGTAMAISGAAVSPNMGYNSSPLITFLLTLFNVRLGWWLGNPKYRRFADEGPRWAAAPLLFELFGLTNDKRKYVYLSDGGHFENLGLYEMVRRRCHLIIISDAGQDPELAFADLANAVRKISIDLGVRIVFPKLEELRVRNKDRNNPDAGGPCYTVGRILYSEADGVSTDLDGYILYLKPGFRGDEPADIVGYAAESTDFPHESTVDQWFSESQFESYRGLGASIMERAHKSALENYQSSNPGKEIKSFAELPDDDSSRGVMLSFFRSLSQVEIPKKTALPGATER